MAPGLRLPENGSVLLLDTFQNQPQLLELAAERWGVNRNRAQNMIRAAIIPIPITSSKQTIEIEGQHATVQAHATLPSIYINLNDRGDSRRICSGVARPAACAAAPTTEQPQQPWDRFHIVRARAEERKAGCGVIKINPLGKVTQQQNLVATTCQQLTGGWVKVTPTAPLEAGEYAVVELLGRDGMNMYVWDFGVNPAAPANAAALKPTSAASTDQPK